MMSSFRPQPANAIAANAAIAAPRNQVRYSGLTMRQDYQSRA
jgi:hypothetical protein